MNYIGSLINTDGNIVKAYKDADGFSEVIGWNEKMNQDWKVLEDAERTR